MNLRETAKHAARRLIRRAARRAGFDTVPSGFYSPIVDPDALPPAFWDTPDPMPGLELDLDRQLTFIADELSPYIGELDVPVAPGPDPQAIHLDNPYYGPFDAHVLYAMVRRCAPGRVLELGSGFSSLFIDRALSAAGQGRHEIVDPYPSPVLAGLTRQAHVEARSAVELAPDRFAALQTGDILFVDTSHSVRPGGEVVRVVLEVLPELAPGVVIHFHDIFRPFPYPRILLERFDVHWQEQYLVQALLADSPRFEVLCANHALWRFRGETVLPWFGGLRAEMVPSGFWLRRTEAGPLS
jgi:predicted O-methyltransferase YrrM